jgi:uncharacterized protein (UPF0276 family)
MDYVNAIPAERVGQIHLAGHTNNGDHLIDTHDHPVADPVWELYREVISRMPNVSTMVEWDDEYPKFSVVEAELQKAKQIAKKVQKNAA